MRPRTLDRPETRRRLAAVGGELGLRAALAVSLEPHLEVLTVARLTAGFHRLKDFQPQLVVLDTDAPDLIETNLAFLVELLAAQGAVPIFLIGTAHHIRFRDLLSWGSQHIVLGPFNINALLERIRAVLSWQDNCPALPTAFSRHVIRAIEYFARHYGAGCSLESVSQVVGVSQTYLSSRFRAETGKPPMQFLARMRFEMTRELLIESDLKLNEVAGRVGFYDASHLSRLFLRIAGQRPTEFRDRYRRGIENSG
jgi:AraC-like DNA-binding protein